MTDNTEIAKEWDANARVRHGQITSGLDISYNKVLIPAISERVGDIRGLSGIDVGCGTGVLTRVLASQGARMVGVDLSRRMIEIANAERRDSMVTYHVGPFESVSRTLPQHAFDFAVANMSFNCILDLEAVMTGIAGVLKPRGWIVFTVAHPFFWQLHREWEDPNMFQYGVEHSLKVHFVISLDPKGLPSETTYFHRPLSRYCSLLERAGFAIRSVDEPMPTAEVEKLYPARWRFPRFLLFRCELA